MTSTLNRGPERSDTDLFDEWSRGYGVIAHTEQTQARVAELLRNDAVYRTFETPETVLRFLMDLDRLANAGLWLVVHMTYARNVYTDGRSLEFDDFKEDPQGHTGGSLNMVPAYAGYLAANALTNETRSWIMGQGHCVSAIDSLNVLVDNMLEEHDKRYDVSDEGLTQLVRDFYSYEIQSNGLPESPLGSHVNVHTAGGLAEGGYLGFVELLYAHMPEPGERLVAFLSDGAFEEQRGSDWVPRWWRHSDCGSVLPVMIANGRRIDQRTTTTQMGGTNWLEEHLDHNHFDPVTIDGHDPAAFVWALVTREQLLEERGKQAEAGERSYPVSVPYVIAECVKGYGFPGAGTNSAHNLPLSGNPSEDPEAQKEFNEGAHQLHVPPDQLDDTLDRFRSTYENRPKEREHSLANQNVGSPELPEPIWHDPDEADTSPMKSVDNYFVQIVKANPDVRVRVGNPDEIRSNRLDNTLDLLHHRVSSPEAPVPESLDGSVITALNEEAVVCAALGNRGGLNLVATYEAFGVKMLGALRQEIIFSRQQSEVGHRANWLGVPIFLTSHTWENGKNEYSHQDPTLCEALLGEMSDHSRVVFPPSANAAQVVLRETYRTRGQIWTHVVPKSKVPVRFSQEDAETLAEHGVVSVRDAEDPEVLLIATGSFQLEQMLVASDVLTEKNVPHSVLYLQEPGRFRKPRDEQESDYTHPQGVVRQLIPASVPPRVFLTHTRPEPYRGVLDPIVTQRTSILGYRNRGGTLDVFGMLFSNRCTWAHVLVEVADQLETPIEQLLTADERSAVKGNGDPDVLRR